jgi:hypothetical protein
LAIYAGVTLGMLLGTKYIGLIFGPTVLGVLALAGLAARLRAAPGERLPVRALAGHAVLLAVAAAVVGGYTYLRNWVTAGNPIFPEPVSLFGRQILPGLEGVTLAVRRHLPWFPIDVRKFLLSRSDLLGSLFPFTMLPAALVAPLVALWRRRWRDALVFALPSAFFLEFLYLMHDHRDMRYFLPGVALAAVAFVWLLEEAGPRASVLRLLLLLVLPIHLARKLDRGPDRPRVAGRPLGSAAGGSCLPACGEAVAGGGRRRCGRRDSSRPGQRGDRVPGGEARPPAGRFRPRTAGRPRRRIGGVHWSQPALHVFWQPAAERRPDRAANR